MDPHHAHNNMGMGEDSVQGALPSLPSLPSLSDQPGCSALGSAGPLVHPLIFLLLLFSLFLLLLTLTLKKNTDKRARVDTHR